MSPEQINIAIAKACGWKRLPSIGIARYQPWCHESDDEGDDLRTDTQLPNYHGDLNAMHEAEKVLTQRNKSTYWDALMKAVGPDSTVDLVDIYDEYTTSPSTSGFAMIHATSAQRAEAFLRTLNLWTP